MSTKITQIPNTPIFLKENKKEQLSAWKNLTALTGDVVGTKQEQIYRSVSKI